MAENKIISYDVELLSTNKRREFYIPEVYTNDLYTNEFQFNIIDMTAAELSGATATVLLDMKDGSFFNNADVTRSGNTFKYVLKENEGNHFGIAKVQLVVKAGGKDYATPIYNFAVMQGLDDKIANEVVINDLNSETRKEIAKLKSETNAVISDLSSQWQQVIDETTGKDVISAPEILAARGPHLNLSQRLLSIDENINKNANSVYGKHLSESKVGNVVSFYIDDGHHHDYDIIKPISEAKNVPFTIACIPNAIDYWGDYALTIDQLKELQASGWEINSHTYNHVDLSKQTEEEIEIQLKKSKDFFENEGLRCNSICYPYGYFNETVMKVARKHYRSGLGSEQKSNKMPINTYGLYRYNFDSYDLEGLKNKIDTMKNEWAVIYMHSETWVGDKLQANINKLNGIIDYVKNKNIPTLTVDKSLDFFENKIDVGSDQNDGLRVGADGSVSSQTINMIPTTLFRDKNVITSDTSITKFEKYKTTITAILNAENFMIPFAPQIATGGILFTHRLHENDGLSFQVYHLSDGTYILKRRWNTATSSWGEFKATGGLSGKKEIYIDSIPANGFRTYDIPVVGVRVDGSINVTFENEQPDGLIFTASCPSAGIVRMKFYNVTATPIPSGVKHIFYTHF